MYDKNPTGIIAKQLLKQIEEESPQSFCWLLSSINRYLQLNPAMPLSDFSKIIQEAKPEAYEAFKAQLRLKNHKIVI